jgi:competence protein ComEA
MTTFRFIFLLISIFSASIWIAPGVSSQTTTTTTTASSPANPTPSPAPAPAVEQVDINSADVATLDRVLDGIGPKKAQAIVDFRDKHGLFKTLSDFQQVPGIGPKVIERNKNRILIVDPNASKPAAGQPASAPMPDAPMPEAKPQPETKQK